jgi:hypothetical protein
MPDEVRHSIPLLAHRLMTSESLTRLLPQSDCPSSVNAQSQGERTVALRDTM